MVRPRCSLMPAARVLLYESELITCSDRAQGSAFAEIIAYLSMPAGIWQSGKKVLDTILLVCPLVALLFGLK